MHPGVDSEYFMAQGITKDAVYKMVARDLERGLAVMIHPHREGEPCIPRTEEDACTRLTSTMDP